MSCMTADKNRQNDLFMSCLTGISPRHDSASLVEISLALGMLLNELSSEDDDYSLQTCKERSY